MNLCGADVYDPKAPFPDMLCVLSAGHRGDHKPTDDFYAEIDSGPLRHAVCRRCKRAGFVDPALPLKCAMCGSTRLTVEDARPREGVER